MLGGGAFAAVMAVLLLSFAAAWGLAEVVPRRRAFLIVGLVWAAAAAVLAVTGKPEAGRGSPARTDRRRSQGGCPMGTTADELSAEQLRQQLDEQRGEIGQDLVAIGDRVSPKRMTERKTAAVREKLGGVRESVMGAKDTVVDKAGDARTARCGGRHGRRGRRPGPAGPRARPAGHPGQSPGRRPHRLRWRPAGRHPAAVQLPGAAARRENVQPQLEAVAGEVGVAAQETVEAVKPAVQEAVTEVKDDAQQAVAEVKDSASSSAPTSPRRPGPVSTRSVPAERSPGAATNGAGDRGRTAEAPLRSPPRGGRTSSSGSRPRPRRTSSSSWPAGSRSSP